MRRTRGLVLVGGAAVAALALAGCEPVESTGSAGGGDTSGVKTHHPRSSTPGASGSVDPSSPPVASSAPETTTREPAGATTSVSSSTPVDRTTPASSTTSDSAGTSTRYGNPNGHAPVPAQGRAVDTSKPTRVIGTGTPASCTSAAVVAAVAAGGVVTFNCGPDPVTITLTETAKVRNANPRLVLDGGGKVTLSGGGSRRILYQNTCDKAQGWTTTHCDDQGTPSLVVQNLTFADGNSTGTGEGGGAIFVRGGQLTVVNSRFVRNRCASTGPDQGGAALRVFDMYRDQPVYVVNSTFGGAAGQGGVCSNGGGLSSIGVSWVVLNSLFSHNQAIGTGANPARAGTSGGGSGGALYLDGNRMTLTVAGTLIEDNSANEGGGAIFFVSNNRTGTMSLDASTLRRNPSKGFETAGLPGIFFLGASRPSITGGTTLAP
jgi:hypothetical protein